MVQMDMPFFCSSLCLSGTDPVSGLVAGAFKAVFFNECFEQKEGIIVKAQPVVGDSSGI